MPLTQRHIKIIHVAKTKLALDEDTYRDILFAHAGVRSSKALNHAGFRSVMKHFEACGFKSSFQRTKSGSRKQRPGMATEKQLRFQSTPPYGGRPLPAILLAIRFHVSIHAPVWGATHGRTKRPRLKSFNPRPRMGGD